MKNSTFTNEEKNYAREIFDYCLGKNPSFSELEVVFNGKHGDKQIIPQKRAHEILKIVHSRGILPLYYSEEELGYHPNRRRIVTFYNSLKEWFRKSDDDCTYACGLSESDLLTIRSNYRIGSYEIILFKRDTSFWSNNNQGLVITDEGFYCIPDNDDKDSRFFFSWEDFDRVRYKELRFNFYNNNDVIAYLGWNCFYKGSDVPAYTFGPKLAEVLTQIAQLPELEDAEYLAYEGKYDEALQLADSNLESDPQNSYYHYVKAIAIYEKVKAIDDQKILDEEEITDEYYDQLMDELGPATQELEKAFQLADKKDTVYLSKIRYESGCIHERVGMFKEARDIFMMALDGCEDKFRDNIMERITSLEGSLDEVWNNYTTFYEYNDRKFIMPVNDHKIGGCWVPGINVFRMSNIPSCFKFPTGHPVPNQLYIGHPYNPALYVPFEESEDIFFVDKVHELCYILECLGAEEINITSIKGKNISELNDSQGIYSGSADVKEFSGEIRINMQYHHQGEMTSNNQRTMRIKLDPMRKPFLPEGLIWYDEQPQWQRLVNSRINGNMLEYNEFVSSSQTKFTSNQEKTNIKADAKYLWAKVNADVDKNIETQFKETTETQWKVDVKFRSIKDFANVIDDAPQIFAQETKFIVNTQMTDDEQSYAEEVKFCLEDGAIGDKERRFLDRMRTKLGISPERATEIEESLLKPQLTEDEQEYLDAVKDEIMDGMIPESSKRLLNRLRKSFNISEDRAKEIEKYATGK